MRTRRLGTTGYDVTEIGYGAWGIGGDLWRGGDDDAARDALRAACDAGIRFFDTALAYGDGHSERLIAEVIGGSRIAGETVIATKIPPRNLEWPGRKARPLREIFPARHVISCVETSLRNLGLDAIQINQLHVWHDAWLDDPDWPETRRAMERLRDEGKVLHWGISCNDHDPGSALRALGDPIFESAQVIYNIYDRSPEEALFPLAARRDLGVIVRVPFDEGALTGAITPTTRFDPEDWRATYFRGDRIAQAARRAEALAALLGEEAATLPELALRFCLAREEVSTVIPGMRRAAHVRANAAVSDGLTLSAGMLRRLEAHAWAKNWYPWE